MTVSNHKKTEGSRPQQGWYEAVFVQYLEKDYQNITCSCIEFKLIEHNYQVWAIMPHNKSFKQKMARIKQALGMSENSRDFKHYYNKNTKIYIEHVAVDGKVKVEAKDFDKSEQNAAASSNLQISKENKQILIIDDQPEVATLLGNYVRQLGFIPVVKTSVGEAKKNFNPDNYLMVISDVIMPGENGFDLVRYIHNKHPRFPIALMSGYFDKEMQNLQKIFGIEKIYRKPVFLNSVREMIFDALKEMVPEKVD